MEAVAIFPKLAGSFIGLLLVLYGTLNLWLTKTKVSVVTRERFCQLLLCEPVSSNTPTNLESAADKPLNIALSALQLNPASAYRWADLADAEVDYGDLENGKFCIRQALAYAPGNPSVLFHAANFYLRLEDYPEALRRLIAVLRNPDLSAFYNRVFSLYSGMDMPLTDLLNQGLPHSPDAANAFLRFWVDQGKVDEAQETWTWINQNSLTSVQSAGSYAALLAKAGRWTDAMKSWSVDTAQFDVDYGKFNWIFNNSFEMAPVESPFDWRLISSSAVQVERDADNAYKGSTSLRLKYTSTPNDSAPAAYQTVVLKPGVWELKAAMKTYALTGDQGVVIRIVDAEDTARLNTATNTFTHTQDWTTVSKVFQVGPETGVARVEIIRPAARDVGVRLMGIVWIDSLSLAPVLGPRSQPVAKTVHSN